MDSCEIEVLITSLVDKETWPRELFGELYHRRWHVEEDYKTMKCCIEIERFTGKSVLRVYQDFYAHVFFKNLVAFMAYPIQSEITASGSKKKHDHQINFTYAIGKAKHLVVLLFQRTRATAKQLIQDFQGLLRHTTEPIRPGRK